MTKNLSHYWRWATPAWINLALALVVLLAGRGSVATRIGEHWVWAMLVLVLGSLWSIPRHWALRAISPGEFTDVEREAIGKRGWFLAKIGTAALVLDVFVWLWWPGPRSFSSTLGLLVWILGLFGMVLVGRGVTAALWPPKRHRYR